MGTRGGDEEATDAVSVLIDPERHEAVLFDLDGVVTDTAAVHAAAWQELFDDFLAQRPAADGEDQRPFTDDDYRRHVDGKRRHDGVADFLASRGISLPVGDPDDDEEAQTVHGLGARKNRWFRRRLEVDGVQVFGSTVELVRRLHRCGVATALFTSSRNADEVLARAGLDELFAVRVDGVAADRLGLAGKPDPAMLCEAARRLAADPARCVVVEDAASGVEAGRRGGFGLVVGVDRHGDPDSLARAGADGVVGDLAEVGVGDEGRRLSTIPAVGDGLERLADALEARPAAVFVDFDGTMSDIVDEAGAAEPVAPARPMLEALARRWPVAVISGRDLADVAARVDTDGIWYAGSHGMELAGPRGEHHVYEGVGDAEAEVRRAADELERRVGDVPGASVEPKRFAVAVHVRQVDPDRVGEVEDVVREVAESADGLRVTTGRAVIEVRPALEWDKGRALGWLLDRFGAEPSTLAVYAGDDLTDEDALVEVAAHGMGIVVRSDELGDRRSAARLAADGPAELCEALARLAGGSDAAGLSG